MCLLSPGHKPVVRPSVCTVRTFDGHAAYRTQHIINGGGSDGVHTTFDSDGTRFIRIGHRSQLLEQHDITEISIEFICLFFLFSFFLGVDKR